VPKSVRQKKWDRFLEAQGWGDAECRMVKGDASFRSYKRLIKNEGAVEERAILMDAPPEHEDVIPFIRVDELLREAGTSAPQIYARDVENGFLLLEDLGVDSFSQVLSDPTLLTNSADLELELYRAAASTLKTIQSCPHPEWLRPYDNSLLLRELKLFTEWYLGKYRQAGLSSSKEEGFFALWEPLFTKLHEERQVLVHRDYHADNLLWLPERKTEQQVGLLDFQDAVLGHPAYDLVSLLEDARRDVREETIAAAVDHFLAINPAFNPEAFRDAYAILGAQRNLKIIGIFSRLAIRDQKERYLDFLPRVWRNLLHDLSHPVLSEIRKFMVEIVPDYFPQSQEVVEQVAPKPVKKKVREKKTS
jgi:aminoglycoside/choline kinase family phosphotransferase